MKVEIRTDGSVVLSGYVNVVERDSKPLRDVAGVFIERVKAKTFQRALDKVDDVGLMFNHTRPLGSTKDCLTLREDSIGLYGQAVVTDEEVKKRAEAGELRGWSFGFSCNKDDWETRADGMRVRTLEDIDLVEVSILDISPAYIATSIEMRDAKECLKECRCLDEDVELIREKRKQPEPVPENNLEYYKRKADYLNY